MGNLLRVCDPESSEEVVTGRPQDQSSWCPGYLGAKAQRTEKDRGPERNKRHRGPEPTKNQRASTDCSALWAQRRSGKELKSHNRTYHESPRSFLAGVAIFPLNGNIGFTDSEAGTEAGTVTVKR